MLSATLMEVIVVELVSTQSIVHNVFVKMKQHQYWIFHVSTFLSLNVKIYLINKESIKSYFQKISLMNFLTSAEGQEKNYKTQNFLAKSFKTECIC